MDIATRQARLRLEFAGLYPGLGPGTWESAAELADRLLAQHLLHPSPGFMLSDRILPEEHFEFRGGAPRESPRNMLTRRTDR